jgi:hypothetical protein
MVERYKIDSTGVATWSNVGGVAGTAMTLNSTGLGVGVVPSTAWNTGSNLQIGIFAALYTNASLGAVDLTSNSIRTGSDTYQYLSASSNAASRFQQRDGSFRWFNAAAGTSPNAITFTQAMTLDASGNLLVGRTSVAGAERLCVEKDQAANEIARFRATHATDPYGLAIQYTANISTAGNDFAAYYVNTSTIRFGFRSNGGMANYQANNVNLSDSRTKTDIKPLASYWNKIKALELVTFKYNDQSHSDDNIGLIAQQVESVAPEFVDVDGFGKTPEDGVPLKTIYTTDLYHASIKALQEAMARIEVLEAKLA